MPASLERRAARKQVEAASESQREAGRFSRLRRAGERAEKPKRAARGSARPAI